MTKTTLTPAMTERAHDLATVMEDIGVDIKRVSGDEINGRCPVHHLTKGRESSRYSWYMNTDSGLWHCFTCGARGNLPLLVSQVTGNPDSINAIQTILIRNGIDRLSRSDEWEEPEVPVDWIRYSRFAPLPESILNLRNLDQEVANRFGVKWGPVVVNAQTGDEENMTIIPIVSPLGELMGWQGKKTGRFVNVPTGVHKGRTLFGIERARSTTALLVESPLDVVRFAGVCGDMDISPIASFGANVSSEQIQLIQSRFDRLVVALDNPYVDKAGLMETRRLAKLWQVFRKGLTYWDYSGTTTKDIGDMEDAEIRDFKTTKRCP